MRIVASFLVAFAVLFGSGCTIWQKETTNRGGFLDYVLDVHWLRADSKGMRALRAFAIQVSLARIASVSAKNDSDRQLLAIRIGALTKRFLPVYACAFDTNPLGVRGAQSDPCFYYDSAMADYTAGLFDFAMIALPVEDAKKLVNLVTASGPNPVALLDLIETLLAIGRDAIRYGYIVGALYRDTIELEVQVWLGTPDIDTRPAPYRVTDADVAVLRGNYLARNDNMPAWIAEIARLRNAGLEPLPQLKFFGELGGLMRHICNLITKEPTAVAACTTALPVTVPTPPRVLGEPVAIQIGSPVTGPFSPRDRIGVVIRGQPGRTGGGSGGGSGVGTGGSTGGSTLKAYEDIIAGYNPAVHTISLVEPALAKLCIPKSELRRLGETTKALIQVFQLATNRTVTGKLQSSDIAQINNLDGCPADRLNYYEAYVIGALNSQENITVYKEKGFADLDGATVAKVRSRIPDMRQTFAARLKLKSPALSNQMTPDLMIELSRPRL